MIKTLFYFNCSLAVANLSKYNDINTLIGDCTFLILTDGVKIIIFSLVLAFILGTYTHFKTKRYNTYPRLSDFNSWKTYEPSPPEDVFSPNNLTTPQIPNNQLHENVWLSIELFPRKLKHLGNVLFQFASKYGIARANRYTPCVNITTNLNTVFEKIALNISSCPEINENERIIIAEMKGARKFHPETLHLRGGQPGNVFHIQGYYQSWKYFSPVWKDDLENRLKFSTVTQDKIDLYLRSVLSEKTSYGRLVGIHIRRGDFIEQKNAGYIVSNITYIENAIKYYERQKKETMFVVATNDPTWTKTHVLPLRENVYLSPFTSPVDDLCLLASCNDSIITGGSYGWWSAYMAGGSVVYDNTFPRLDSSIGRRFTKDDYYPPQWVGL